MAISAKFTADFASFYDAVDKAEAHLVDMTKGAANVERSLSRMVDSFSGRKLIQDASLMAKAVEDIGGPSKLTAAELARVGAQANEAAAKLKALGQDVPAKIQAIADAAAGASHATGGWLPILHELGSSFAARVAEGVLLRDAVHEIIGVVKEAALALPELALKGASIADVEENFKHLTAQAGLFGTSLIGAVRTATHGTIGDFELMKTITKDLGAGLNLTEGQFKTLADGAFALAKATGTSVKDALDTMNDAMLTGRTRSLALLTGKIDLSAAETAYAQKLGTTSEHLSDAGKMEAARAGILEAVTAATKRLGEQTDGLDERVDQAHATWENFQDDLGKTIATSPVLAAGIDGIRDALVQAFGGSQATLITSITQAIDNALIAVVGFGGTAIGVGGDLVKGYYAVAKVFGDLAQIIEGDALAVEYLALGLAHATHSAEDIKRINGNIDALLVSMKRRGDALQEDSKAQANVDAVTAKYRETLERVQATMKAAAANQASLIDPLDKSAHGFEAATAAGGQHADMIKADTASIKAWGDLMREVGSVGASLSATIGRLDGTVVEGTKYYIERGLGIEKIAKLYGITTEQVNAVKASMEREEKQLDDTTKAMAAFEHETVAAAASVGKGLQPALMNLAVAMGDVQLHGTPVIGFLAKIPDYSEQAARHMANLRRETDSFSGGLEKLFKGNLAAGFSELGSTIKKSLDFGSILNTAIGGGISGLISSGVSLAVTGLKKLFGGLFHGISDEEKAARASLADFQTQLNGTATATQQAEAAGNKLALTTIQVRDAMLASGHSATDVDALMARLWDTHNPAAYKAALAEINAVLGDAKTKADDLAKVFKADVAKGVDGVLEAFKTLKSGIPEALRPAIDQLVSMNQLTVDEKNKLIDMVNDTRPKFEDLIKTSEKYGITLASLGPTFQQGHISDLAQAIYGDFRDITDAGGDVGGVLTGMSGDINKLVLDAKHFGASIPEAMRPLIQNLIDAGRLTDENGNKLTDLSEINFNDTPMMSSTDKLVLAINHLSDILGGLPGVASAAASGIASSLNNLHIDPIRVPFEFAVPDTPTSDTSDTNNEAARGGIVTEQDVQYFGRGGSVLPFRPRGTDTVPAMLTPGEVVFNRGQQQRLLHIANGGEGGANWNALVDEVRALREETSRLRAEQASQSRLLPKQLRDAILLAS